MNQSTGTKKIWKGIVTTAVGTGLVTVILQSVLVYGEFGSFKARTKQVEEEFDNHKKDESHSVTKKDIEQAASRLEKLRSSHNKLKTGFESHKSVSKQRYDQIMEKLDRIERIMRRRDQ